MTFDEKLEQQLLELGNAVAPQRSIVADVMSQTVSRKVAPSRLPSIIRWWSARVRPRQIAATAAVAGITFVVAYLFVFDQQSASAFADHAMAALERAKANGVTVKERTVVVMRDGSRHTSSTSDTLFVGRDSYRRDIYDSDQLREVQWYTPDGAGMLQTSVRFDTKTYTLQRHEGGFGDEHPVERMRFLIRFIDDAHHHLDPMMIKGRQCPGFEIRSSEYGDNPDDWVDRIWFDPVTKLPTRIEEERPRTEEEFKAFLTVREGFDWHPDLPADTFTPRIPDGFTIRQEDPQVRNSK